MNDAQLFVIFFSILAFGWLGFFAGRGLEMKGESKWAAPCGIIFFIWSIAAFFAAAINLFSLVIKNF